MIGQPRPPRPLAAASASAEFSVVDSVHDQEKLITSAPVQPGPPTNPAA